MTSYNCIVCGNTSHADVCPSHASEIADCRRINTMLHEAVRNQLSSVVPGIALTSSQRAAIVYNELSSDAQIGVCWWVNLLCSEVYQRRLRRRNLNKRSATYFGAMSALELLCALMEAEYI